MVKVLEVNVDDNGYGGVYAFVLNILENIGKEFRIDLCSFEKFEKQSNIDYVESFGGKVHYCGFSGQLWKKQLNCLNNLYQLAKSGQYDVVHIHSDVSYKLFLYALTVKMASSSKILIHSHSSGVEGRHRNIKSVLQRLAKPFLPLVADKFIACSQKAARWMYPRNIINKNRVIFINNGVNVSNFRFDLNARNEIRKSLNLRDEFVVGHVGRFSYPKNHMFLIDIFAELVKIYPKSKLLLIGSYVGDPSFLNDAKSKVLKMGLSNKVLFLGIRNDVPRLMQAMDCFLLPSRFEGLPVVGIEAQAAGLPCFFSDVITKELGITKLAHFISLKKGPREWAMQILKCSHISRQNMQKEIGIAGYDIQYEIKKLEKLYQ
ncbi:glycosyltransferase [Acidaminococcus timonensis]|uniref:glycosyltransferase n=1 Tax=Acidaminococcus timonensis TaxID=1871002 RepID=UPI002941D23C|nr:glycosyltransferase [Acidaminococcus timonensis]